MWGKYRNFVRITLSMCLCVSLSCFLSLNVGAYTPPTEPQTTITMSMTQYNQLKEIISRQDSRLEMLQQKLTLLKNNSVSVSSELEKSQTELTTLRNELTETQESLESAKISLTQAEEMLKKQEESLQTLTKEIKSLEHKQTVMRRQRDVYATLFVLSVGSVIARR